MVVVIINQYERALRFTLGRYTSLLGPGLALAIPFIHTVKLVDIRIKAIKIPSQETLTKDNIPIRITAVVYYKIEEPEKAVLDIANVDLAVMQYAQSTMRDVIGKNEMDKILSDRESIAKEIQNIVDQTVRNWGVDISAIKIQDIELPEDMKRSIAKQAEGERIRRATVILAEGELAAAKNFAEAAKTLSTSEESFFLKTLQSLTTNISLEDAPTNIVIIPKEFVEFLHKFGSEKKT